MSYKITDIEGIGPTFTKKLKKAGIHTTDALLKHAADKKGRKAVAAETGIALSMEPFQITPGGRIPGARDSRLVTVAEALKVHFLIDALLASAASGTQVELSV